MTRISAEGGQDRDELYMRQKSTNPIAASWN